MHNTVSNRTQRREHLQVPETKPNNKNTKKSSKMLIMQRLDGQCLHKLLQG